MPIVLTFQRIKNYLTHNIFLSTEAVLSNQKFLSAIEHDIKEIIKSWLVGVIGRMKKHNLSNVENNLQ